MNRVMARRRPAYAHGFTIVELLIVIVVIAILAAVTVVAYNGITKNARQSSLLSDISNAATIMATDHVTNGSYAASAGAAHDGLGLPASPGVSYSYHSDGTTFCITARSSYDGINSYYVSTTNPKPTLGECPEDAGVLVETAVGDGTVGAAPGTGTAATLAGPAGLAADSSGSLYFTDQQGSRIRKMTTGRVVTNLAGNGPTGTTDGVGTAALFNWPQAVTIGPGNVLYVADTNNSRIRTVPLNGTATGTFAGSSQGTGGVVGTSVGAAVQFNTPRGIVYNPVSNTLYIADSQSNRIRVLDMTGKLIANIGTTTGGWKDGASGVAQFNYPQGLAVDSTGLVYVADTLNHRIRTIDSAGNVVTITGSGTQGNANGIGSAAQFKNPMALTVSSNGTIYVADTGNNLIRKIAPDRTVTTIAGDGTAGYKEGSGTSAEFNEPKGIALGSDGKLYVTDRANNRIRVITL